MRLISFDVGMKNLAYCIVNIPQSLTNETLMSMSLQEITSSILIEKWDVIDLRVPPEQKKEGQGNGEGEGETGVLHPTSIQPLLCYRDTKRAKYMMISSPTTDGGMNHTIKLYCAKCASTSGFIIPDREILSYQRNKSLLQKKKVHELGELLDRLNKQCIPATTVATLFCKVPEPTNKRMKKEDMVREIERIIATRFVVTCPADMTLEGITRMYLPGSIKPVPPKKAHDLDLITYGRNLAKHLDAILLHTKVDMMIVENQISTIATRMKTLQGMITQYFIMRDTPRIEYISASNKLKLFMEADAETTYSDRKKMGIDICRRLLPSTNPSLKPWIERFNLHKKKDDLADCLLQGLWRIKQGLGKQPEICIDDTLEMNADESEL
jgi:hypothetical protein